jgi:hypothetical protein
MGFAVLGRVFALAVAPTVAPANVTGKWEGKITAPREDGSSREDAALLILEQKETTVTGSIGGSETDQHKITSGSVADNKVTIKATTPNGRELTLELTVENDEMKGTIKSGERVGQLTVKRKP